MKEDRMARDADERGLDGEGLLMKEDRHVLLAICLCLLKEDRMARDVG